MILVQMNERRKQFKGDYFKFMARVSPAKTIKNIEEKKTETRKKRERD